MLFCYHRHGYSLPAPVRAQSQPAEFHLQNSGKALDDSLPWRLQRLPSGVSLKLCRKAKRSLSSTATARVMLSLPGGHSVRAEPSLTVTLSGLLQGLSAMGTLPGDVSEASIVVLRRSLSPAELRTTSLAGEPRAAITFALFDCALCALLAGLLACSSGQLGGLAAAFYRRCAPHHEPFAFSPASRGVRLSRHHMTPGVYQPVAHCPKTTPREPCSPRVPRALGAGRCTASQLSCTLALRSHPSRVWRSSTAGSLCWSCSWFRAAWGPPGPAIFLLACLWPLGL
jgi:hypothetical protein